MTSNEIELVKALTDKRSRGKRILAAGVSSAEDVRLVRENGADFAVMYHFGRYPLKRKTLITGMMPYGSANEMMLEMGEEVLPQCGGFPVLASVCATDPFRLMEHHLRKLARCGYAGIHNYPSVGLIDGNMRVSLESNESGYRREVELMRGYKQPGGVRCALAFSEKEARQMAEAGVEILVIHTGVVSQRQVREGTAPTLASCAAVLARAAAGCRKINPELILLCHGWPMEDTQTVEKVLEQVPEMDGHLDLSCFSGLEMEQTARRIRQLAGGPAGDDEMERGDKE